MKTLDHAELQGFLSNAAIDAAAPELRIGRELTSRRLAQRTIVIHFGSNDSTGHVFEVVSILLSSAKSWLLVARHGRASQLGDFTPEADAEALVFDSSERERLGKYLCTRDMALGSVSQDLYLVAFDGSVLITWDHHTSDEGLRVDVRDIEQSSALLEKLNTVGTEFEVFYADG